MGDKLTISQSPPHHPGMDWTLLRKEAIQQIQKMLGNNLIPDDTANTQIAGEKKYKKWTDYNAHDPGITILEVLCYAITDLSYRIDFDIEDILALPEEEKTSVKQFFEAKDVLSINPLTTDDYRKLLLDINGVKNAWLNVCLEDGKPKGFYDVFIVPDDDVATGTLENNANGKLETYRNLCEAFRQIEILTKEPLCVEAEIETNIDTPDIYDLGTEICLGLSDYICPSIKRYSLKQMLDKGQSCEEIYNGYYSDPSKGFVDDTDVKQFNKKTEVRTSDMINIIMDDEKIKRVKNIWIYKKVDEGMEGISDDKKEKWLLEIGKTAPKLDKCKIKITNKHGINEELTIIQVCVEVKIKLNIDNTSIDIDNLGYEMYFHIRDVLKEIIGTKDNLIAEMKTRIGSDERIETVGHITYNYNDCQSPAKMQHLGSVKVQQCG